MNPSPISEIFLDGRRFFVKRDDLIDPFLAGNKFRKLYALLQTPNTKYNKIISYGGTQSNAMLAIAAMCSMKNWKFTYYSKPMSKTLKEETSGNFAKALRLGMVHVEIQNEFYREYVASLEISIDEKTFLIDQGGADALAQEGLAVLAQEIREVNLEYKSLEAYSGIKKKALNVYSLATPSGTGTTALYLALSLPEYKIYTTPCVGDSKYLKEQMRALHPIPENLIILEPSKKYHFAKPYPELYAQYKKLLDAGIEFDLLYAPSMFQVLQEKVEEEVLYIHSGGVSGNKSMLQRYEKKAWHF